MQTRTIILAIAAMLLTAGAARADVFNLGGTRNPTTGVWTGVASLEMVHVGDPGNVADTAAHSGNPNGQGAVSYEYNIGKYEVTAGQYCAFLNAVATTDTYSLYNTRMSRTDYGCGITQGGSSGSFIYTVDPNFTNRPVNFVSYWDSCRFVNWLANGQLTFAQDPTTTEHGTYTLNGYNGPDGRNIQRNANSTWAVTSEDEWYKAAYYKGGGTSAGYWLYPTRSDTAPGQNMADPNGNNANYPAAPYAYPIDGGKYTTMVGEFQNSPGPYGTFDQVGNVCEWNEAIPYQVQTYTYVFQGLRGGAWGMWIIDPDGAKARNYGYTPADESGDIGFRVSEVPEPATLAVLALGGIAVLRRRRGLRS